MGDVSPHEYYDRQLRVPGWGPNGQATLERSCVLIVGVGGLGCPVLSALARSGVGRLIFCDPDRVEASNLPRQTLFTVDDVGRSKVEAAAQALATVNPWIALEPRAIRVDRTNVRPLVESADLIVDGSDNFATKFLVHDACRSAGKPLVMASLYQWEAQVNVFDFSRAQPGCWRCLYREAPEDGCVGVCADVGVAGALAGLAGHFQALACLRLLLGLGGPEPCSTWIADAADWSPRVLKWKPLATCSCNTGANDWNWLESPKPPRQEALWEDLDPAERSIVVDVRESSEIADGEWEWLESQGSQIIHYPWTQWSLSRPEWDSSTTYLILCAHGFRSLAAVRTTPQGVRALSLTGGMARLSETNIP